MREIDDKNGKWAGRGWHVKTWEAVDDFKVSNNTNQKVEPSQ